MEIVKKCKELGDQFFVILLHVSFFLLLCFVEYLLPGFAGGALHFCKVLLQFCFNFNSPDVQFY